MTPHASLASLPDAPAEAMANADYYQQCLRELVAIGMKFSRQLDAASPTSVAALPAEPQTPPAPPAGPSPAACAAFNGLARTVRRCILLADRLDKPAPATRDPAVAHQTAARRRIIRDVEDAIQRHPVDEEEADSLHAELVERLDGPELDDEIDDRPVADIIADICRDLGLEVLPGAHPWKRRTPADITALCQLAAPASRPSGPPSGHPPPAPSGERFARSLSPPKPPD